MKFGINETCDEKLVKQELIDASSDSASGSSEISDGERERLSESAFHIESDTDRDSDDFNKLSEDKPKLNAGETEKEEAPSPEDNSENKVDTFRQPEHDHMDNQPLDLSGPSFVTDGQKQVNQECLQDTDDCDDNGKLTPSDEQNEKMAQDADRTNPEELDINGTDNAVGSWEISEDDADEHEDSSLGEADGFGDDADNPKASVEGAEPGIVAETNKENANESIDDERDPTLTDEQRKTLDDLIRNGEIDIPESSSEVPKEGKLHLPSEQTGRFEGEPGDSLFIPSSPEAMEKINEYGRQGVEYRNGHPDFEPFCIHDSPWGTIDTEVEIPHMTDQRKNPTYEYGRRPAGSSHDPSYDLGNYAQADNELRDKINNAQDTDMNVTSKDVERWRKANNLVWHEAADGKTMQLIPQEIHDGCRHSGGISNQKTAMAYGNYEP